MEISKNCNNRAFPTYHNSQRNRLEHWFPGSPHGHHPLRRSLFFLWNLQNRPLLYYLSQKKKFKPSWTSTFRKGTGKNEARVNEGKKYQKRIIPHTFTFVLSYPDDNCREKITGPFRSGEVETPSPTSQNVPCLKNRQTGAGLENISTM